MVERTGTVGGFERWNISNSSLYILVPAVEFMTEICLSLFNNVFKIASVHVQ